MPGRDRAPAGPSGAEPCRTPAWGQNPLFLSRHCHPASPAHQTCLSPRPVQQGLAVQRCDWLVLGSLKAPQRGPPHRRLLRKIAFLSKRVIPARLPRTLARIPGPTPDSFLDFRRMSYCSARFWPYLPGGGTDAPGEVLSPTRPRPTLFRCQAQGQALTVPETHCQVIRGSRNPLPGLH